jgi:hypothetical protein
LSENKSLIKAGGENPQHERCDQRSSALPADRRTPQQDTDITEARDCSKSFLVLQ